jgi:hypothetical protein
MLCACTTVEEAIRFLQRLPHVGKGYNFVLADAHGAGVALECACPMVQVRRSEPGQDVIFCTNTYKLPALLHADLRDPVGRTYSELRYHYLERKLLRERVPRTVDQIKALLSAHGPDGGLCRPIDEGDARGKTYMSAIVLPAERKFWFTDGQPCAVAYEPMT